jgi:hypothetical protein
MAVNPLLLLMILMVFRNEHRQIPHSRGALLARIAYGLLGKWELSSNEEGYHQYWIHDKHKVLELLGYKMELEGLELSSERATSIFQEAIEHAPYDFAEHNLDRPTHHRLVSGHGNLDPLIGELKRERMLIALSSSD